MEPIYRIPDDLIVGPETDDVRLASANANWGMAALQVQALRNMGDGDGIIVGVVDTGADVDHPVLKSQILAAKDFTGSNFGSADRQGHGTHTASTIAANDFNIGVAPGARLVIGKGLGDSGSGGGGGIAAAMRFCADNGANIISMSIGSSGLDSQIDEAGQELSARGIFITCSAGNSGPSTPNVDFPARLGWALSIAAVDQSMKVASFSSSGKKIECAGPGVGIWGAKPGGGYQQMSGTSMSCPFVAGVLALWLSARKKKGLPVPTLEQMRAIMLSRSFDVDQPGVDNRAGPGVLSPTLLMLELTPLPPAVL